MKNSKLVFIAVVAALLSVARADRLQPQPLDATFGSLGSLMSATSGSNPGVAGTAYFGTVSGCDLARFQNITVIFGSVLISGCGPSSDLSGLSRVTYIQGDVEIFNCLFATMPEFSNLTAIGGNLTLQFNSLINVAAFARLTSVGGSLTLGGAYGTPGSCLLDDVNGFLSLTHVGGDLSVSYCSVLKDVDGFASLQHIGQMLRLYNNANLTDVTGFSHLQFIGGAMDIEASPMVTSLAFPQLSSVGSSMTLNLDATVQFALLTSIGGDLSLSGGMPNVDGFANLTLLGGNLLLTLGSIHTVDAFSKLAAVPGALKIQYCQALMNVNGFANVGRIGGDLTISSNTALMNTNGFSKLTTIGGILDIGGNQDLSDLTGFNNLISVDGPTITICGNSALTTIPPIFNSLAVGKPKSCLHAGSGCCNTPPPSPPWASLQRH